jgi:transposase
MGQRGQTLTQVLGYRGWRVVEVSYERVDGTKVTPVAGYDLPQELLLVLRTERRWVGRCAECQAICGRVHEQLPPRRWADLSWAGRPTVIEYAPQRLACRRCGHTGVELLAWADTHQRQTRRLQHYLAIETASMPVQHVAALHGLDWSTVKRAEVCALERWQKTRQKVPLRHVGIDEKYLGRRSRHRKEKFVTIFSNLETGEPLAIEFGRSEETVTAWLQTLTKEEKAGITLFSMDMHQAFLNAVRADPDLAHAVVVHDPFHVMKRVGAALDELRREVFFRAGPDQRRLGRGKRWLYLRSWERCSEDQRTELRDFLKLNRTLARGYQLAEEIRAALHAPDRGAMWTAINRVLLRTSRRDNVPLRKLHESLLRHWPQLLGLADHRPATGRVEALNNNWETLVRRSRGHRDLDYLLLKLRFTVANPIRSANGVARFRALGLPAPIKLAA